MLKHLSLLILVILASALAPGENPPAILAQGEEEPSNSFPFNENMSWDEAEQQIEKAVEGDEEAAEKVSSGRLAWVPLMVDSRWYAACLKWSHALLADESEWLITMQRWEVMLGEADGAAIVAGWKEREKLFRHAEAQLARGIIACGLLGDRASMQALVKVKPDSVWVKASLGWLGEYPDARQCVDAMLAGLDLIKTYERYVIFLNPGLLDAEASRHRFRTREYCNLECELMYDASGMMALHTIPLQWRYLGLVERLGCRISELPTSRDREKAIDAVSPHLGAESETNWSWRTLLSAARPNETAEGPPVPGAVGQNSRGPLLREYATANLANFDMSRRWSALVCFHGQPDWQPAQRWAIKEALLSRDSQYARLVARAVLGIRDDMLDGIVSVAAELGAGKFLQEEAKLFRKALNDSGNATLKSIAQAMTGTGKFPASADRKAMGLPAKTRAGLVAAFAEPVEIESYGDEIALLWMNRGHFLTGHQRVYDALDAFSNAIKASQSALERRRGLATSAEAYWALQLSMPVEKLELLLNAHAESHPEVIEALRREQALRLETPPADADDAELTRARMEKIAGTRGEDVDDDLREFIENNPSYAGGYGLSLLGFRTREEYDYEERNDYWRRGQAMAPSDSRVWFAAMPGDDNFLRYRYYNWFSLEHDIQCLAVVRPFITESYTRMASVAARAGTPARELTSLLMVAGDHALVPYYGGKSIQALRRMQFTRTHSGPLLNRVLATYGPKIHRGWHTTINQIVVGVVHGWDVEDNLHLVNMGGQRGEYIQTCADYEIRQFNRMQDVNNLLNFSIELVGLAPQMALDYIERAEKLGVSPYGRFVASQMYIRAKCALGEWDEALARYRELRGKRVGYPPYLDHYMLHGLTEGNQYQHLEAMFKEFKKHEMDMDSAYACFSMRRALMASGRHREIKDIEIAHLREDSPDGYNFNHYSPLFHEARPLLEDGNTEDLHKRAQRYWNDGIEDGVGVQLDAYLLMTLASKLAPTGPKLVDDEGMIRAAHKGVPAYFIPTENCLDTWAFRILAGQRKADSLPPMGDEYEWHGMVFSERPTIARGSGFLSDAEGVARDHFVRGLLAFFVDDHDTARAQFEGCMKEDQRCSHEYHVAEWLLANKLAKKD